jgi:hypothetical protein
MFAIHAAAVNGELRGSLGPRLRCRKMLRARDAPGIHARSMSVGTTRAVELCLPVSSVDLESVMAAEGELASGLDTGAGFVPHYS